MREVDDVSHMFIGNTPQGQSIHLENLCAIPSNTLRKLPALVLKLDILLPLDIDLLLRFALSIPHILPGDYGQRVFAQTSSVAVEEHLHTLFDSGNRLLTSDVLNSSFVGANTPE